MILHAGTNDLTKESNTIENLATIYNYMKTNYKDTDLIISEVTVRKDSKNMPNKVKEINKKIKEFCTAKNVLLINHDNIEEECLGKRKLHLNRKGKGVFARNFKHFLSLIY